MKFMKNIKILMGNYLILDIYTFNMEKQRISESSDFL